MRAELREEQGCFAIDLTPETVDEAAICVRFAINRTQEVRHAGTCVAKDGTFLLDVVLGKRKAPTSCVPQA